MSLALGRTSNYTKFTLYSKLHPDNLNPRETVPLPVPVRGPAAIGSFTPFEKAVYPQSAWGHKLTAESPFGPMETRTRLKVDVAPKVGAGGGWQKTVMTEKAQSTMCSAMYAGSQIQMSCCEAADRVRPPRSCARTHTTRAHLRPWSCTPFEEIELRSEGYCSKEATFGAYHDSRVRVRPAVRHRVWAASNSPEVAQSRYAFRKSSSRCARDTGGKREVTERDRAQQFVYGRPPEPGRCCARVFLNASAPEQPAKSRGSRSACDCEYSENHARSARSACRGHGR